MAINFPASPALNDIYRYGIRSWQWNGAGWQLMINPAFGYGDVSVAGSLTVDGSLIVNGTTTTINSTTLLVDDKNIELGSVATPTDTTADGGGITLRGSTDKTIIWDNANDNWTVNQNWNLASTYAYKINNVSVLSATTLGSAVVGSSLTSVGTLANLIIGAGTNTVAPIRLTTGGTALTTPVSGAIEYTTDSIFVTTNPGSTTTGPGRGIVCSPQMVFSLANSTAAATTTPVAAFASGNDVLSVLEPAKLYRFSGKYYTTATFTSGTAQIQLIFAFTNAPTASKYSYKTYLQTAGGSAIASIGAGSATTVLGVSPAITATINYVTEFEGYFTTHATSTSTLTPQFQMSATGSSTVITAGSWFQVEKLGTSTTTLIAGNWA